MRFLGSKYARNAWWGGAAFGLDFRLLGLQTSAPRCPPSTTIPQTLGRARIHTAYKSKQRSRSFILGIPIDSSHMASYRLSVVTFALGRTV